MKVMTIVGTRPEIIKLSRVIAKFDQYFEHCLVHTGQNYDYELNKIFFAELNIREPDYVMDGSSSSPSKTISRILFEIDDILEIIKPDAVVILGDTNSSLSAIAAKKKKIPIFHLEAGNRCFNSRVPEEINRKIVDHISDVNLTYSTIARDYLLREGLHPQYIIKVGSPMAEVLDFYKNNINSSKILEYLNIKKNKYIIASIHREENVSTDNGIQNIAKILNSVTKKYSIDCIVSTHPRTKISIQNSSVKFNSRVRFMKPFGFFDYVKLQQNAKFVLSDSGTITEESSILNFPAINLRNEHERPEGSEEGAVIFTGLNEERVLNALEILDGPKEANDSAMKIKDYATLNVSEKVVKLILSYTHYINRNIWGGRD